VFGVELPFRCDDDLVTSRRVRAQAVAVSWWEDKRQAIEVGDGSAGTLWR
jgi:hypothetical protein